jgi:CBS domain-containing protein
MSTHPIAQPASPLAGTTVRSAMQLGLFYCLPEEDLHTLARMMAERSIHCVVIGGIERPPGDERPSWAIVSDLDLVRGLQEPAGAQLAGDLATTDVVSVSPHDTLETAARLMTEHATAHLLVASPDSGIPVGILSTLDIARAAAA